jgi:hypothetical protein
MGQQQQSSEATALLDEFAALTTILKARQQQVIELGAKRQAVAKKLREGATPLATVEQIAKRAGIGTQAVYKLLSAG